MNHFTTHIYRGQADLEAMLALVSTRPVDLLLDYPSPADLREMLMRPAIQQSTCLWETPEGRLAGYALLNYSNEYANLAFEYRPELANSPIGAEMIAWGETFFRQQYSGQADALWSSTRAARAERVSLLEAHGFQRDPESQLLYARDLAEPIPDPLLPPGYRFRPSTGEAEVEAWVTLHRAAFCTQNMTVDGRLAILRVPDYDPDLDLLAVAPDGALAAYVVGSIHPDENHLTGQPTGFTDPVATHPRHQRQGLARALLLESLKRLKARGMAAARLGTSSQNIAMQRAAESVGFRQAGQVFHYAKPRVDL